jgi:hypothetical protein
MRCGGCGYGAEPHQPKDGVVIWFYERRGKYIRCETRDVPQRPGVYELVVAVRDDGAEQVERFTNSEALMKRQEELEQSLQGDGWYGPFGRVI